MLSQFKHLCSIDFHRRPSLIWLRLWGQWKSRTLSQILTQSQGDFSKIFLFKKLNCFYFLYWDRLFLECISLTESPPIYLAISNIHKISTFIFIPLINWYWRTNVLLYFHTTGVFYWFPHKGLLYILILKMCWNWHCRTSSFYWYIWYIGISEYILFLLIPSIILYWCSFYVDTYDTLVYWQKRSAFLPEHHSEDERGMVQPRR